MGGFLGIGGSSTKADRAGVLDASGELRNVFNYGLPEGKTQEASGNTTLDAAMNQLGTAQRSVAASGKYWGDILSGDRTAILTAAAPEVNAVNEQADAMARQEGEMGTARGGGTNAENQALQERKMATIDNAIFAQRGEAAKGELAVGGAEAGIGATEAGVGSAQLQNALQLLGLTNSSAANLGEISLNAQKLDFSQQQAIGKAVGQAILAGVAMLP